MNRRTIASWCLYDFANSFYAVLPAVLWTVYYREVIVGNEQGLGDFWWGWAISGSMLVVALSSPPMGAIADYAGVRKRLLVAYTVASVSGVVLYVTVEPGMVIWGMVVTMLSYVGFEGALVFYNAYLPEIAPPEKQGRVSGWGFGVGYAGSLLGLLLALGLIRSFPAPLGPHLTWLGIAAAYLIFSLPAFFWLPKDSPPKLSIQQAARGGVAESWKTFREILSRQPTRRFLLAYFFYEDGVNTVIVTAAAFASKTLEFKTEQLIILFAIVQFSALAGAFLWAKPTDVLGPKRVVSIMLVQWALVVTAAYFVQNATHFYGVAILAGTGLGAIQAASRAFMASLIPRGREGDYFGFYHLCGKSAAILGPLLFGYVSLATGGDQRSAILSVLALFVVGGLLLTRVRAGGPTASAAASTSAS
jgi:UMF1 family MFS transporter